MECSKLSGLGSSHATARPLRVRTTYCTYSTPPGGSTPYQYLSRGGRVSARCDLSDHPRVGGDRPLPVEFTALMIYRIHEGKIAQSWGEVACLRLMRQLRVD